MNAKKYNLLLVESVGRLTSDKTEGEFRTKILVEGQRSKGCYIRGKKRERAEERVGVLVAEQTWGWVFFAGSSNDEGAVVTK